MQCPEAVGAWNIPETNGLILAAAGKQAAVRAKGNRPYMIAMSLERF